MKLKLPNELICCLPSTIEDPIRIGCDSDGGYIIPKKLLDHCDDLLSCGLGENWSFDRGWKAIKPNSKIHMYDGTVSINRMKDYLQAPYRAFFTDQATHFEENIGPGFTEFSKAIDRLDSKKVLLKMDIEGGEFPLLDDILANKDIFPGIVIEIHFANHRRDQFVQAVKKLQQEYVLVHLHGNNHTIQGQDGSCDCFEFTFIRHDLCTDFNNRYNFYLDGLDFSNVPGLDDYEFYFEKHKNEFSIAVLIPTRGRTDALKLSTSSLIDKVADASSIQLLFAFDNDDTVGLEYFETILQPYLDKKGVAYTAMCFDPVGYSGLNLYYNTLANNADADWLFVWNDDCVMKTKSWDTVIKKYDGQFKVLKVHTHNDHPYSIFPIVPSEWYKINGQLSRHQMIDAEISQIAFMLDIIEVVDIDVLHDRADLTGNNQDETNAKRIRHEGNPKNPGDFNNFNIDSIRKADANVLSKYMKSRGIDTTFWENVKAKKQDPWEKLKLLDINHQQFQFDLK